LWAIKIRLIPRPRQERGIGGGFGVWWLSPPTPALAGTPRKHAGRAACLWALLSHLLKRFYIISRMLIGSSGPTLYTPSYSSTTRGKQLIQTMKHVVTTLVNFGWKILLLESFLLLIISLIWYLTDWHTTTGYGAALGIAGGTIIGLGLIALMKRGSSDDMILRKARMLNPDYKNQHLYTPHYAESTRVWFWFIGLGIVTIGMGIAFNVFIP
jgi:hypothetical protein